ncbi:putative phytol kinase 3, chloroplastic [Drosera capensis]
MVQVKPVNPTFTLTLTLPHHTPIPISNPIISRLNHRPSSPSSFFSSAAAVDRFRRLRRSVRSSAMVFSAGPVVSDLCAVGLSGGIAVGLLQVWKETAKRGIFDQKLNRKLVHVSIGLVFMLCWPLFSSGYRGAVLAGLIPGVNIIHMLLLGLGLLKDEATVKSMSRYGNYRELLKGPLYYASTITIACMVFWRTSPIGMAAICNLCAGDGFADIIGRRFGHQKLPFNRSKSIVGSIAMASAGFLASVGYMFYFSWFGYIQASWDMVFGVLIVSLAATVVESLPISTDLDDNLTVPLTSLLVGILVL